MNRWKTAAVAAVAVAAAGVGAALAPAAHGQTRVARAQGSRALEVLTGGSRIGVSIRDVEDGDTKNAERRERRRPRGGRLDRQPRRKGRHPQRGRDRRVRRRAGPERAPADAAGPGNRSGANRRRDSSARRAADDGLGHPARRQQLQLPRARRSRRLGPGVPLPSGAARAPAGAAAAAEPAQPSRAADPTVATHGLGLRRHARPRRPPRHLDRFAVSAAGRILRHQGRRARHVRLRRFGGGQGRAEGGRRDHQLQRRSR